MDWLVYFGLKKKTPVPKSPPRTELLVSSDRLQAKITFHPQRFDNYLGTIGEYYEASLLNPPPGSKIVFATGSTPEIAIDQLKRDLLNEKEANRKLAEAKSKEGVVEFEL